MMDRLLNLVGLNLNNYSVVYSNVMHTLVNNSSLFSNLKYFPHGLIVVLPRPSNHYSERDLNYNY